MLWYKIENYIRIFWFPFVVGVALTMWAADYTMRQRGYFAIGGEWLILPMMMYGRYMLLLAEREASKRRRAKRNRRRRLVIRKKI